MKICPNCHNQLDDAAAFCPNCGAQFAAPPQPAPYQQAPNYGAQPPYGYAPPAPAFDPYDHTSEFDAKDISENKVISMLVYLLGAVGIVIALLASNTSPYAAFHVRQALKFTVVEILVGLISGVLAITFIVPIAGAIFLVVLSVIKFICFFQICGGKAKEPAIIRGLKFLR